MNELFLDASYAIALSVRSDLHHHHAVALSERLDCEDVNLVTTRAILVEVGNALARARYREAATGLLASFELDPQIVIVPLSEDLYHEAFGLYRTRGDKEWGLTDCISFVVMRQRGIRDALTADEHFRQAGFRALLREA